MTRIEKIISVILTIAFAIVYVLLVFSFVSGCSPRPTAYPISSSHSALTATDYDLAEAAFSGGPAPMPAELAVVRCQDLLDRRDLASAFALGLSALGGGTGLATLIPKDATPDESKRWDLGLGISTLAVGTTAVILGALVRSWSAEFESECGTKEPAPVEHPAGDEVEKDGGAE